MSQKSKLPSIFRNSIKCWPDFKRHAQQ